ncbi:TonB-dependent receptor [Caulobacter sp. Root1455]|uniref:TonB-dependent receptor n=1 Tax=Caulobacter sp. Root1455 TaxID=1736465 RepID=UPI0006F44898|nr:TonB-dependent receptor plug domain-containing protein [Caulobacter sp. Root1455]KQZ04739.1 TonB-dependent receptor [Caulobacter sp. Root1455]
MISDTESQLRLRPDAPDRSGTIAVVCPRHRGPVFALTMASSLALAGAAEAAPARFGFNIPAKLRSEALIDVGVQARVTLGGVSSCPGRSAAVVGLLTLRQALDAVTAGAPCRFEILDNATVSIRPVPIPSARFSVRARPPVVVQTSPMIAPALDSVIVTATKRPTRLGAAAGGVSVISAARLRDTGAIDTTSISQQTAGFITTNLGAARNKIMLRGLSDGTFTGRTQQTVGTYLDNIPLTYNAPDPDLRLIDVDRVEVLRGPQGALYGGGSLSGVYRIVSSKPVLNQWSGSVLAGAAATESGSPSSRLEGVFNLPLAADRAAVRVAAYNDVDGGYVDDVNLRLSNVDRTTRVGGRAALSVAIDPDWSILVSGARQDLHATDSQYTTPSLGGQKRANQVRETHDNVLQQGAVTLTGAGGWGRFVSSTGYVRHRFASRFDATAALNGAGSASVDVGLFDEASKVRLLVEDAVLSSPDTDRFRWLFGLYGLASLEDSEGELRARTYRDPSRLIYLEARRDRRRELALYGETAYDLGDGWTASLGGRAFRSEVQTTSMVEAPAPGQSRELDRQARFTGLSPKFSLQRTWSGGGLFYLLTSEGYRSGGFNSGGLVAPSTLRASFKPDHLRNYEIGAGIRPWGGRMILRTALFHDVWTDIQTDQYLTPSGLSYTANVGDGRNTGLEIEAAVTAARGLTLEANALFNRPRLSKVDPNFASAAQSELPGVPDVSAGAMMRYQTDLAADRRLVLTTEIEYVGQSRLTFDRRLSPSMGGYVTGRLSAEMTIRDWSWTFAVTNPANASSDTFAYGNPFSFGQVRQVTPLRPRTWSLLVSRAF